MPLPDLPEPNYFKLEQICIRWGCDEDHLLQYCKSNMLEIGVILDNSAAYQINDELGKDNTELNGFYALSSGDVEGTLYWGESPGYEAEFCCQIKQVYMPYDSNSSFYCDFREMEIFVDPKFILDRTHVFAASSLVIEKTERDRFESEHSLNVEDVYINNDSLPEIQRNISIQEKRELILKGWLIGKSLNTELQLELTREEVWTEISKADKSLFRTKGKESIKAFFKKAKLCSFKLGKRKGK